MPLYEYRCASCGSRFEVLQRVGQGGTGLVCPKCGRTEVEKQFSTFAGSAAGSGSGGESAASSCSRSGRFT